MKKRGFTLVELLAVIAIISILATIGVTAVIKVYNDSVKKTMIVQENNVAEASKSYLEDYCIDPLDNTYKCPSSYENNSEIRYICLSDLQDNEKGNYVSKVNYKNEDCKGIITFSKNDDGEYINAKTYLYCDYNSKDKKYNYVTDETLDTSLYPRCNISSGTTEEPTKPIDTACTFNGELKQGAEFVSGQYTYRYKQEGRYNYSGNDLAWNNIEADGWGVQLTDKTSTKAVTSKLCTYINNKPIISMAFMFSGSKAATIDLSNFDTSKVINMKNMFASSVTTALDLSSFDTSNVTNMSGMFSGSVATTIKGLNKFNTSKVTDMTSMFYNSQATTLDLSNFDTSNVKYINSMFYGTKATTLDVSSFDTSKVTSMYAMFANSQATTIKGLNNFDTSNVKSMFQMFLSSKATTLDVSNFDTSNVTDMADMFLSSQATTLDVSNFNTSKVTLMNRMFSSTKATTLDVSKFDTSKVTSMYAMFANSQATTIKGLNNFDTSKVTNMGMMFYNNRATMLDVSNFNTSKVTTMQQMFSYSQATTIKGLNNFDTSNVTSMWYMFNYSRATTLDVSKFDTSKVTNMGNMFRGSRVTTLDLSQFNTSNVTDMSNMFSNSFYLKTIYSSGKFNTSAVATSSNMFTGCTSLVGGAGTKYNSSYVDKTYARIDGGTSSPGYFTSKNSSTNAGKYIRNLSPKGLETTARNGLYRFVGTSNNYINIGGISYRIIGITDNSTINTSLGLKENQLKLIKATPVGTHAWSSSRTNDYPFGNSSNDLYTYLNNTVINNTSVIPSSFKNSISSVKWYNGDASYGISASAIASYEMESITSKTAKLGLMYLSDYFYSSTYGGTTNCYNTTCNSSWIYNSSYNQWTMTRNGRTNNTGYIAGSIDTSGKTNNTMVVYSLYYSPVFYLNENMVISSGNGSFTTPFIINIK